MTDTGFQVGELIENRYRVLDVIGKGGMGILYRVSDEAQGGEIMALKMVRLEIAGDDREYIEYFQHEFQLLTQLYHPNLVSVYDYGITTEGRLYFTMEWVEGQDLDLHKRRLTPGDSVSIIVQICRALTYLHSRGVLHGDLKPANVLLMDDAGGVSRRVKLVDFGIALEINLSEGRGPYHSPGFSAPETRESRPIDNRTDLYSLGALWYALLVGEPPTFMFGADRLIPLALHEALENQKQVLVALGNVIARLLATSPDERYANANEVIKAVNGITGSAYDLETRETVSSYALRTRFVNREAEMEVLRATWEQAKSGEGKLLLVNGQSGVGKTRLVEELKVLAEMEGARVVWGQCVESGSSAHHPWREVLRVLMRYVESTTESELEIERVGPVVAVVLPELWERDYMADLVPPAELDPHAAQQRLHKAMVQVLRAAARIRPTMVVIEDAQWADEATLAMLSILAHTVGEMEGIVCVTYRSDEISPEHLLVKLMGDYVLRIPMQTLLPQITTDLACSMLGLEELPSLLTERVQQTTGGNAFFVQELIRSLAVEGQVLQRTVEGWQVDQAALRDAHLPESIRQVVGQRLDQLSKESRQVLQWAAVVGMVFWEGCAAEAGQVTREWVQTALQEIVEQELVAERNEMTFAGEAEYLFNNSTVWEAAYANVLQEERQEVHSRAAGWLMAHSDEEASEHLGLIADHLERAGQVEDALVYLQRAGDQAAAQFAHAEAAHYLSRALDLMPKDALTDRYDLLLLRENVYDVQGTREAQNRDLTTLGQLAVALDEAQPQTAVSRQVEVALRQSNYGEAVSDFPTAAEMARRAIDLAREVEDVSREAEGHCLWGGALWRLGEYEEARHHLELSLPLARVAGRHEIEANSLQSLGIVSTIQGDHVQAGAYMSQGLQIYHDLGVRHKEAGALNNLAIVANSLNDYVAAHSRWQQGLSVSREIGDRYSESLLLGNLGVLSLDLGEYSQAIDYGEQALQICREIDNRLHQVLGLENLARVCFLLGAYDQARGYIDQALPIVRQIKSQRFQALNLNRSSWLSRLVGKNEMSVEQAQQALLLAREAGVYEEETDASINLGWALTSLGRLAEAADAYQNALSLTQKAKQQHLTLQPLAGLANVSLMQGELEHAQAQVEKILQYLETHTMQGVWEPGQIYLICYRVLHASQDPRADGILQTAHDMLQERVAKINDEELRRSFLENVAAHREIVREFSRGEFAELY
ncbi:MAG: tetratricopeptide repeat protein [Chloroflexi bacterium]|nr:tetratricopeptide repeat protein [Chloroflexota bacterium]